MKKEQPLNLKTFNYLVVVHFLCAIGHIAHGASVINLESLPEPYRSAHLASYDSNGKTTHAEDLSKLLSKAPIKTALELGSLRDSTLHVASCLPTGAILYMVDPFVNDPAETRWHQFLSNIIHRNLTSKIVPLRMTYRAGFEYLRDTLKVEVDFIYRNGPIDYQTCLEDLEAGYPLLSNGGVFCGDSFSAKGGVVGQAVKDFCRGIHLHHFSNPDPRGTGNILFWNIFKGTLSSDEDAQQFLQDKGVTLDVEYRFGVPQFAEKEGNAFQAIADHLGFPLDQRQERVTQIMRNAHRRFLNIKLNAKSIPLRSHRLWFTPHEAATEMPPHALAAYLECLQNFSEEWTHYFWVADPSRIPHTVQTVSRAGVKIRNFYEIPRLAQHFFDLYFNERFMSAAGDIARLNIILQEGGLYNDCGMNIEFDPFLLMGNYDSIWSLRKEHHRSTYFHYVDGDFFAAKPGDPIIRDMLMTLENLPSNPHPFNLHLTTPLRHWDLTRPAHIMLAFDRVLKDKDPKDWPCILPFNGDRLFIRKGLGSWIKGTLGSKRTQDSNIDIFQIHPSPFYTEIGDRWRQFSNMGEGPSTIVSHILKDTPEETTLRQKRRVQLSKAQNILLRFNTPPCEERRTAGIPLQSHRGWITTAGQEVPDDSMEAYLNNLKDLGNWDKHSFWCLDPTQIPKTISKIRQSVIPVEIHTLDEILPNMYGKYIYDFYIENRLFAEASNIARYNIIYERGGMWSDIGGVVSQGASKFLEKFDIVLPNIGPYLDIFFLGARKKCPAFKLYLEYLENLKTRVPGTEMRSSVGRVMQLHDSQGLAYWIDTLMPQETRLLLVPENSLYKRNGLSTWHGKGTLGSKGISLEEFQHRNFITQFHEPSPKSGVAMETSA